VLSALIGGRYLPVRQSEQDAHVTFPHSPRSSNRLGEAGFIYPSIQARAASLLHHFNIILLL
jgi:hypothetical protein